MKKLLLYALFATLSVSCKQSADYFEPQQDSDVKFVLNVSDDREVEAKSSYTYTDVTINNIDMLVFDKDKKFLERVKIDNITVTGSGSTRTFYAKFAPTTDSRTIHFVINGRNPNTDADEVNFSSITPGMLESVAIPNLRTGTLTTGQAPGKDVGIVMWGRATLASGVTAGMLVNNVDMLRAVAAIEIRRASNLTKFTLISATANNSAAFGKVAPDSYLIPPTELNPPTESSLPAGLTTVNYHNGSTGGYWNTYNTADLDQPNPVLYVYERKGTSSTDCTSIIIKGAYNGVEGYYKVVMTDQSSTPKVLDIVRNNKYILTIYRADGAGYPTVADAIAHPPMGLKYDITEDNSLITNIVSDGTSTVLGISNDEYYIWTSLSGASYNEVCKVYLRDDTDPSAQLTSNNVSFDVIGQDRIKGCTVISEGNGIYTVGVYFTELGNWAPDAVYVNINYKGLVQQVFVRSDGYKSFTSLGANTVRRLNSLFINNLNTPSSYNPNFKNWKVEYISGAPVKFSYTNTFNLTNASQMTPANGFMSVLDDRLGNDCYMYIDMRNRVADGGRSKVKVSGNFLGDVCVRWYDIIL